LRTAALLSLALLASPALAFKSERITPVAGVAGGGAASYEVVAEQVLVKFSSAATTADKAAAVAAAGGVSSEDLSTPGWTLITLSSGASVVPALTALRALPSVSKASPNRVVYLNAVPTDPGVAQQYSLTNTNAFGGWEYETGFTNRVTVAVIDSGIDGTHPDLTAKLVDVGAIESQSFPVAGGQAANQPPTTSCDHGTGVASVAAASTNNNLGIAGVSWGAQLISLKVFDPGCAGTSDLAMSNAINYAANTLQNNAAIGKVVINMSIGGPNDCAADLPLTDAALANAVTTRGVPVFIASGNSSPQACTNGGNNGVHAPGNCAGVSAPAGIIPVGATDSLNDVASFSCRGAELSAHGVVAPGKSVLVDSDGGDTVTTDGTSFSSPFAAGLAALMLSAKPTLTPAQIESNMRAGAYSIGGQSIGVAGNASGAGQVNVFRTMKLTVTGSLAGFEGDQKAIAFPNPFRLSERGTVSFSIPASLQGASPKIKVYTADGILVRTLNGLTWDGKNESGKFVASGTYVFFVSTGAGQTKGRVAVIR
jgi:subtilisin family serine protease